MNGRARYTLDQSLIKGKQQAQVKNLPNDLKGNKLLLRNLLNYGR